MSIAAAGVAIEELADDIRRENDRRYAFYRMLHATDRVLWRLEEFNRDGIKQVPGDMRVKMRGSLTELPMSCMEVYRDSDRVQEVLDSVFEVQERLLRWRDPQREMAADDEEADAAPPEPKAGPAPDAKARFRARVLRILCAARDGVPWSHLVLGMSGSEVRERHSEWLDEMEAEGLVHWVAPSQGGGRRYFAVGARP